MGVDRKLTNTKAVNQAAFLSGDCIAFQSSRVGGRHVKDQLSETESSSVGGKGVLREFYFRFNPDV